MENRNWKSHAIQAVKILYLALRVVVSMLSVPFEAYYQLAIRSSRYKRRKHQLPGLGMELSLLTGFVLMGIGQFALTILG